MRPPRYAATGRPSVLMATESARALQSPRVVINTLTEDDAKSCELLRKAVADKNARRWRCQDAPRRRGNRARRFGAYGIPPGDPSTRVDPRIPPAEMRPEDTPRHWLMRTS